VVKRYANLFVAFLFLVIAVWFGWSTMELGETARQVPMVVVIVTILLFAARAFMEIYELTSSAGTDGQTYRVTSYDRPHGTSSNEAPKPKLLADVLLFLAAPMCLYAMVPVLGGAVYLIAFFSARTDWSWRSRLLATAVFTAISGAVYALYAATYSIHQ
jgi:hypothetical protein